MKQIKEKRFVDNESGITSELIQQSTSTEELLNWKLIVNSNIVHTQMKIDMAKGEQAKSGRYLDPEKWTGLNGYRRVLGFLDQKIQYRLRELGYDRNEYKSEGERFYSSAKVILSEKLLEEIERHAGIKMPTSLTQK